MRPLNSLKWADLGGWLQSTGLPKQNALSLLLDPGRSMGTKAGPILGPNIVSNGDFHDFTMENDANTKGHWIFDSNYDAAEGGSGFIGQNWSEGAPVYSTGADIVPTNPTCEGDFTDGLAPDWTSAGTITPSEQEGLTGSAQGFTSSVIINNGNVECLASPSGLTGGKTYKLTFYNKRISGSDEIHKVCILGGLAGDYYEVAVSDEWTERTIIWTQAADSGSDTDRIKFGMSGNGQTSVFAVDGITVEEMSASNHLSVSTNLDIDNQLAGSNPSYKDGNALAFDGVNDYMELTGTAADDFRPGTGNFTIEAWIKVPTDHSGTQVYISQGTAASGGFELFSTDSKVYFRVSSGAGAYNDALCTFAIADGNWHHWAGIRSGDDLFIYRDGVYQGEGSGVWDVDVDDASRGFVIGARGDYSFWAECEIAEVRYSDKARTSTEIMQSYGGAKGFTVISEATLENSDWKQNINATEPGVSYLMGVFSGFESGTVYKATCKVATNTGEEAQFFCRGANTNTYFNPVAYAEYPTETEVSYYFRSDDTELKLYLAVLTEGAIGTYDDVSIRPVINLTTPYRLAEDFSDKGHRLGPNLVTNGDFHDFTMDNDANTKGHWIFDSYYQSAEGAPGYIGLDWSSETPTLSTHYEADWSSTVDGWAANGETSAERLDSVSDGTTTKTNVLKFWASDVEGGHYLSKSFSHTTGKLYKVSCWCYIPATNTNVTGIGLANGQTLIPRQDGTGAWTYIEKYVVATDDYTKRAYMYKEGSSSFAGAGSSDDDIIYLAEFKMEEASAGNHLGCAWPFDYENQLTGSNPAYQNGNMLEFDGVDDCFLIEGEYATDFNPGTGDFTIEAIFRTGSNVTDAQRIFSKYSVSGAAGIQIYVIADTFYTTVRNADGSGYFVNLNTGIEANKTYYAALSVDRDGSQVLYLAEYGSALTSVSQTVTNTENLTNTSDLYIGRYAYSASGFFGGHIAEIRYSDKARTADEIKASYGTPKGWIYTDYTNSIRNDDFDVKYTDVENTAYLYQNISRDAGDVYKVIYNTRTTDGDEGLVTAIYDASEILLPYGPLPAGDSQRIQYHTAADNSAALRVYTGSQADTFWMTGIEYRKVINGNHGVFKNDMETLQPSHPAAYQFDGVNDYIEHGVIDPGLNDFWISLWFTFSTGTNTEMVLASCGDGADDSGINMFLYDDDKLYHKFHAGTGKNAARVLGITRDGSWHNYSFGRIGGKDYRFLDNVSKAAGTDYSDWDIGMGRAFRLGATNFGPSGGYYYSGQIGIVTYHIFNGQTGPAAIEGFNNKLYKETRKRMIKRGLIV